MALPYSQLKLQGQWAMKIQGIISLCPLGILSPPVLPGQFTVGSISFATDPEIVFITNTGGQPLDISGWYMYSHDGTSPPTCPVVLSQLFTFPAGTIVQPGQTIQIQSGTNAIPVSDPVAGIYRWTGAFIWNDNGDVLSVYNTANQLVAYFPYGNCV